MYNPPTQPQIQLIPRRHLSPFWRNILIAFMVASLLGCLLSSIGLSVGLRTGALALPNGMQLPILSSAPDGCLLRVPSYVAFITFNSPPQQGDNSGTIYDTNVEYGSVRSEQASWTGTQSGANLNIIFASGIALHAVWHGTILLVTYQDTSGQLVTQPFVAASISDYNNAVAALQQSTQ